MTAAPRHVLVSGPDGRQYAVDGETQTDVSAIGQEQARIHGRDPLPATAEARPAGEDAAQDAMALKEMDAARELSQANERRDSIVAQAEALRAAEVSEGAPAVNTTETAARVEAVAGFDTVDELPLTRSVDDAPRVVEGVDPPEIRAEDPEPESPDETVAISSGFMEFLRASQPEIAVGASVPMEGDVNAIAGAQSPVQRAYALAETVYEGRGDFVALA